MNWEHEENVLINSINKCSLFVVGKQGIGKTTFVKKILNKHKIDFVYLTPFDIENKQSIENNINNLSITDMFYKNKKTNILVVIDDINVVNKNDKKKLIINYLIKLVKENERFIFIGTDDKNKKINELFKKCMELRLKEPDNYDLMKIIDENIYDEDVFIDRETIETCNTLSKINHLDFMFKNKLITMNDFELLKQSNNLDKKIYSSCLNITEKLMMEKLCFQKRNEIIEDCDRTLIGLLLYENFIQLLDKHILNHETYMEFLENVCLSDQIEKLTFQKQIWSFNEMSFIIRICKSNDLMIENMKRKLLKIPELRFTRILIKHKLEQSNKKLIDDICQRLFMDKSIFYNHILLMIQNRETIEAFMNSYQDVNINEINKCIRYIENKSKMDLSDDDSEKNDFYSVNT